MAEVNEKWVLVITRRYYPMNADRFNSFLLRDLEYQGLKKVAEDLRKDGFAVDIRKSSRDPMLTMQTSYAIEPLKGRRIKRNDTK